jgi:hypothetical protein
MSRKKGTHPWRPFPVAWVGARLSDDGRRLSVALVSNTRELPDRADVRWGQGRLTVTLSLMGGSSGGKMPAFQRCVEIPLSRDASGLTIIDGADGLRAAAKDSGWLDPEDLANTGRTLDDVFTPSATLVPREFEESNESETGARLITAPEPG